VNYGCKFNEIKGCPKLIASSKSAVSGGGDQVNGDS
jgi:hypothetical protein